MPMFVSMTDQYIGFAIAQVGSLEDSMDGTKVMRTIDEIHALGDVSGRTFCIKQLTFCTVLVETYKNPKPNITPTATLCLLVVCRFSIMRVGRAYVIKSVRIFNAAFER